MRIAIFLDQVFWHDGQSYSTDEAYILFLKSFLGPFDEVVFISRLAPEPGRKPYVLDHPGLRVSPIPYYERLASIWKAGPRVFRQVRELARAEARGWDMVLVSGPHPLGQVLAEECIAMGVPVALVVRQNLVPQIAFASKGARRLLNVAYAGWLERRFRRLAKGRVVFTVGQEMADAYGRHTPQVHNHHACLINNAQLAQFEAMPRDPEPGRLICVGRLSPEKGHRYLLAAMARLAARGVRCHLDIVGSGAFEAELRAEAARLGLGEAVHFHGYVPYGPELFALNRRAQALVVPSLEGEGFPQVINEALCIGLPVIASRVGGIPAFVEHNVTGLLTRPADVAGLAAAIERVLNDAALRARLERNGRARMRENTLEANRDRIVQVLHDSFVHA
jgi:glycosyltransferase involved in cell wall biosynthesis